MHLLILQLLPGIQSQPIVAAGAVNAVMTSALYTEATTFTAFAEAGGSAVTTVTCSRWLSPAMMKH